MLSTIRNKSKGWVAYLIVGLITVPFALFGINQYFTGVSNVAVAVVNDDDIMKDEFLYEFNSNKRRIQEQLGSNYDPQVDNIVKQSTIETMINQLLLSQLADKLNYSTASGELMATIKANDMFHTDGVFSMEKYQQLLSLNGLNPTTYESLILKELTQNQIKFNLLNSSFMTPIALDKLQKINDQERSFSYFQIETNDYLDNVSVSNADVENYFTENNDTFIEPQKVKVNFIELEADEIAKGISISEGELESLYEEEQDRFSTEEERKAQHILVETEETANEVLDLINNGLNFADLSKEYSIDTGSKDKAGDLGYFTKGVMVPEFESTVFEMSEGQISSPIKSDFGYHIIKLNSVKESTLKSFSSVRDELVSLATDKAAQKELYKLSEELSNLSYELSLDEVAAQLNLSVTESDFFNQNSTNYDPSFVKSAFSDVVLNKGENSELIEINQSRFVVLSLNEKLAKRVKDLGEVKDEIVSHLSTVAAKSLVDDLSNKVADLFMADNKESANKLMKDNNLEWADVDWVKRNSQDPNSDIVSRVFALSKPVDSPTYSSQSINNKSVIVLRLNNVRTSNTQPIAELGGIVLGFESEDVFGSIIRSLKSSNEVKVFRDLL